MVPQWDFVQGRFSSHGTYIHVRKVKVVDIVSSQWWAECQHSEQNEVVQNWDQERSCLQLLKCAAVKTPRNIITHREKPYIFWKDWSWRYTGASSDLQQIILYQCSSSQPQDTFLLFVSVLFSHPRLKSHPPCTTWPFLCCIVIFAGPEVYPQPFCRCYWCIFAMQVWTALKTAWVELSLCV